MYFEMGHAKANCIDAGFWPGLTKLNYGKDRTHNRIYQTSLRALTNKPEPHKHHTYRESASETN